MHDHIHAFHAVPILLMFFLKMEAAVDKPSDVPAAIQKIQERETTEAKKRLESIGPLDDKQPQAIGKYSSRGDAQMFLADFKAAVADYQSMVRLDPDTDTSHWRLGIALFFAGQPKEAAAQFDKYHAFDQIDRENGIWRFLSHYQAYGAEQARKELLKYEKDDRPPFPEVYRLFDGSMTPEQVLKSIPEDLSETQKNSRLFYSHLYIGMLQVVEGKNAEAKQSLAKAIENPWPQNAGFGPNYMWHVARLQYFELK